MIFQGVAECPFTVEKSALRRAVWQGDGELWLLKTSVRVEFRVDAVASVRRADLDDGFVEERRLGVMCVIVVRVSEVKVLLRCVIERVVVLPLAFNLSLDDAAEDVVRNDSPEDTFAILLAVIFKEERLEGRGAADSRVCDEVSFLDVNHDDAVTALGNGERFSREPPSEILFSLESEFSEKPSKEAVELEAVSSPMIENDALEEVLICEGVLLMREDVEVFVRNGVEMFALECAEGVLGERGCALVSDAFKVLVDVAGIHIAVR